MSNKKDSEQLRKKVKISGLHDLYCGNCNRYLAGVPKSTWTYCPKCRRWSRVEPAANNQKTEVTK